MASKTDFRGKVYLFGAEDIEVAYELFSGINDILGDDEYNTSIPLVTSTKKEYPDELNLTFDYVSGIVFEGKIKGAGHNSAESNLEKLGLRNQFLEKFSPMLNTKIKKLYRKIMKENKIYEFHLAFELEDLNGGFLNSLYAIINVNYENGDVVVDGYDYNPDENSCKILSYDVLNNSKFFTIKDHPDYIYYTTNPDCDKSEYILVPIKINK